MFLETFDFVEEDEVTARENLTNAYLRDLSERSKLHLLQPEKVNAAYDKHGSYGLFHLFITKSMFNCIRMWTNIKLRDTRSKEVSALKFQAYLGLEMATSLLQFNSLKEYWSGKVFAGHDDFKKTMSRDDFLHIRSNLVFCHPASYLHSQASTDPLWHVRKLLEHFQKNISAIAVPLGTSALDEASIGTKAKSRAVSFIKDKPDKYAIRLYAVVGTAQSYVHNLMDNRSGNTTGESGGIYYDPT